MRYMVMHYQTQDMEDGVLPSPEQQAAIAEYMREAAMSGVLLSGEGVALSPAGARVEVNNGTVCVIDGPFAEAKELIARGNGPVGRPYPAGRGLCHDRRPPVLHPRIGIGDRADPSRIGRDRLAVRPGPDR
jgi:hypothetical protein